MKNENQNLTAALRRGSRLSTRARQALATTGRTGAREETANRSTTLSQDEFRLIDSYWRASNFLAVGQIYLLDNPLLRKPLKLEHVVPRCLHPALKSRRGRPHSKTLTCQRPRAALAKLLDCARPLALLEAW